MKVFKDEEEVMNVFKNEGKKLVIFKNGVYDVEHFMPTHPGGAELIEEWLGKRIDEPFVENEHTASAERMFVDMQVGTLGSPDDALSSASTAASGRQVSPDYIHTTAGQVVDKDGNAMKNGKYKIDLDRGMLHQVYAKMNKKEYVEFINDPKHLINPPRDFILFDAPYLEVFSKTPWYAIPIMWLPVVYMLASSCELWMPLAIGVFVFGLASWTLLEYTLHRFLFHCEDRLPDHPFVFTAHFLIHGVHHAFPMDRYRLVFPIVPGYTLGSIIYFLFSLVLPGAMLNIFFAGIIIGYIGYDMTHYWVHHMSARWERARYLKRYHMAHHYKDWDNGYGITNDFWDSVFGTKIKLDKEA